MVGEHKNSPGKKDPNMINDDEIRISKLSRIDGSKSSKLNNLHFESTHGNWLSKLRAKRKLRIAENE